MKIVFMKISILVVTYGDRFNYLKQVLDACILEYIKTGQILEIIIVDNASLSSEKIKEYIGQNPKVNFKHICLSTNTGSAKGYSVGMEYFLNTASDYVLLLDDDNWIEENFIEGFSKYLNIFKEKGKIVLVGNRLLNDQKDWFDDIKMNKLINYSFFNTLLKKLFNLFKQKLREEAFTPMRSALVFPYGGGLIHRNIIKDVGLPNSEYFIYVDDVEWSYRIHKKGYPIYFIYDVKIHDLDLHNHPSNRTIFFIDKNIADFRLTRNWYNTFYFYSSTLGKPRRVLYYISFSYSLVIFISVLLKGKISKLSLKRIFLYIKCSVRGTRNGKKGEYNFFIENNK